MKKTILLILAILPIVLVIVIAFAGRIMSEYKYIPVERVEFINDSGVVYNDKMIFTVNLGESKSCKIKIFPELATNQKVTYSSLDESVCTIDSNGVILGQKYGVTTVIVKTADGNKTAKMNVIVTADIPIDLRLSHYDLTMVQGEQFFLDVEVDLPVALDKRVDYISSNPDVVSVDVTGKLIAKAPGTATITVNTRSGGLSEQCVVTVVGGELPIIFDFKDAPNVTKNGENYVLSTNSINLNDYIVLGTNVNRDDVKISLIAGSAAALDENGVLTFSKAGIVTIRAYIGEENDPTAFTEIKIAFR